MIKKLIAYLTCIAVFTSCYKDASTEFVDNTDQYNKCAVPSDAINTLIGSSEEALANDVIAVFHNHGIADVELAKENIKSWVEDEVFGLDRCNREWQLYDEDFCSFITTKTTQNKSEGNLGFYKQTIPICNSKLNKHSLIGESWAKNFNQFQITLNLCVVPTASLGARPFYEVVTQNNESQLGVQKDMRKYLADTRIEIQVVKLEHGLVLSDVVWQGTSYLYTGLIYGDLPQIQGLDSKQST